MEGLLRLFGGFGHGLIPLPHLRLNLVDIFGGDVLLCGDTHCRLYLREFPEFRQDHQPDPRGPVVKGFLTAGGFIPFRGFRLRLLSRPSFGAGLSS